MANILQQMGVLALAILFSLLFTSMNNREAKSRKISQIKRGDS